MTLTTLILAWIVGSIVVTLIALKILKADKEEEV
jgi:glycerol-3-phosphate acyltransferase PlsY